MAQNTSQWTATGSYSDSSKQNITTQVAWTVSDTSMVTIGSTTGVVTIQSAGKIWGADVGITATLSPGTPGTGTIMCIASDSGSAAPRMPQQNDHWQALGLSPWGTWWGCQEATGNLVGSGSTSLTLTATASLGVGILYSQPIPGWTRLATRVSGATGQLFGVPSGSGPNPLTTSMAFLAYGILGRTTSLGGGQICGLSDPTVIEAMVQSSTGSVILQFAANELSKKNRDLCGPNVDHFDRVHPFLFVIDNTNGRVLGATDVAVMTSASTAPADMEKSFGGGITSVSPSASFLYFAMATGSIVENLSTTSGSADFLNRLGWTVMWKDTPIDSSSIKLPFLPSHWEGLGYVPWTATWNLQTTVTQNNFVPTFQSNDSWTGLSARAFDFASALATTVGNPKAAVPNWKRSAVLLSGSGNATRLQCQYGVAGTLPLFDPTGSFAMLGYVSCTSTAPNGTILGRSGDTTIVSGQSGGLNVWVGTGPSTSIIIYCSGSTTTGSNSIQDGRVHPILLVYDKTNSRVKGYTDLEAVTGTFNQTVIQSRVTGAMFIGTAPMGGAGFVPTAPSASYLYLTFCTGSTAETFSNNANASKLLKDLGWTVTW